jgi:hypothetical protein
MIDGMAWVVSVPTSAQGTKGDVMSRAMGMRFDRQRFPARPRVHALRIVILSVFCLLAGGAQLLAVTVSVSEFEFVVEPEGRSTGEVVILNDEDADVIVDIRLVDWDRTSQGITQFYAPATLARSCALWMTFSPLRVTLSPGAEAEVRFDVQTPKMAEGTYWAGLLMNMHEVRGVAQPGDVGIVRQFLVRVFITVPPGTRTAQVSGMQVRGLNPLGVEVSFSNTGNTLLSNVTGLVSVESSTGSQLFDSPLGPFDVLPGYSVRQLVLGTWGLHTPGFYLVRAVVDFGAEYLVAGQSMLRLHELVLVPVGTATAPPADLDGDGLYEDVDGDGLPSASDADLLAKSLDLPEIQRNARAFDFDNDGLVTPADADVLREIVLRAAD